VTATSSSLAKGWQTIAAESSRIFEEVLLRNSSAFIEKLLGAKSFESGVQIQSEYAKTFFDGFFEYVKKTGELYSNLAKETFKPIENRSHQGSGFGSGFQRIDCGDLRRWAGIFAHYISIRPRTRADHTDSDPVSKANCFRPGSLRGSVV